MEIQKQAKLLRIFISSTDKYNHEPLYQVVVYKARENGIAGATVLKGIMGYGSSSSVYSPTSWEITEKIPLVVEIVDEAPAIEQFVDAIMPIFEKLDKGCMITLEEAKIVLHKKGKMAK